LARTEADRRGRSARVLLGGEGTFLPIEGGSAWARTDNGEILRFDQDGVLRSIVVVRWPTMRLGRTIWQRLLHSMSADLAPTAGGAWGGEVDRSLLPRPRAKRTPVLSRVVALHGDVLWFEPFSFPWDGSRYLLGS
jgi:hypothetical protein